MLHRFALVFGSDRPASLIYKQSVLRFISLLMLATLTPMQLQGGSNNHHGMAFEFVYRGRSQFRPGPGWAGKRPQIDDSRSFPPPNKKRDSNLKTRLAALELLSGSTI